jgi:hypothetical protein
MSHLYFAYGSNLDPRQMIERCPKAKYIGRATLAGWELEFVGQSRNWGGAVANIMRKKGAIVPGTVWRLNRKDLDAMDTCEGHPWVYKRIRQPARIEGKRGAIPVQVYVHQFPFCVAFPSADYVERIAYGYARFNLHEQALWTAIKNVEPDPTLGAFDLGLDGAYDKAATKKSKGKKGKKGKKGRKGKKAKRPASKYPELGTGQIFDLRPIPASNRRKRK